MSSSSSLPCIGQAVRVRLPSGTGGCCRATVSYVDAAEGTVDVVYEDGAEWAGGLEEEAGVALGRLLPLQPFEEQGAAAAADSGILREEGNALFRLGDFGGALARYRLALRRLLLPKPPAAGSEQEEEGVDGDRAGEGGCCVGLRVGATVLVHAAPDPSAAGTSHVSSKRAGKLLSRVRRATVADVDVGKRMVDVIYDDEEEEGEDGDGEEEEEDGVMMSRVVPLAAGPAAQVDQGRLLLNISRVYLKSPLGRLHEALRTAGLAAAALDGVACGGPDDAEADAGVVEEAVRLLLSAHEVRVGALCRGGFFQAAKDDVRRLARLPKRVAGRAAVAGVGDRVKKLWGDIEQAGVERQRDNKRLAKSVSRWLHEAMAVQQEQQEEQGALGGGGGGGQRQQQEEAGCVCS